MELARATRTRRAMAQLASVIGLAVSISTPAAAEIYPSRPIKIISPFSAGSAPDTVGRLVAQQLSDRLRQSVTIENRPGAGTTIATKAAASAEPDGYTLLQINAVMAYSTVLYPNAGYDPVKSFSPVAAFGTQSHFLFTPESVQADSIEGLLTTARATSGALNIGFPLGSPPQVLGELFKAISGAPLNSVPYRQVPQLIGFARWPPSRQFWSRRRQCFPCPPGKIEGHGLHWLGSPSGLAAGPDRYRSWVSTTSA